MTIRWAGYEADQLVGRSSLEQYADVLMRGCRCVEIDVWDGEDGEPIVTHGFTMTTRLRFVDVVRTCLEHAFVATPYPLVLSLEVHCSGKQVRRMGVILNDVLGPQLLRRPLDSAEKCRTVTPEEGKYKVILKGKVPEAVKDNC